MNETIEKVVHDSLMQLQNTLSADEFSIVKSEFQKMHNNEISVSQSYANLLNQHLIDPDIANLIKVSFYNIGYTVGAPARGATQLVRKCYAEERSDNPGLTLGEFQQDVMDYVYGCVLDLE